MQNHTYVKKNGTVLGPIYTSQSKLTILATGPACATCRKTCRGCDRARPDCHRCLSKGVKCGGYPTKFKFCAIASRGKWKDKEVPLPVQSRRREPANKHGGSNPLAKDTHETLGDSYSEMIMDFPPKDAYRDTTDVHRETVTRCSPKDVEESYSERVTGARISSANNPPLEVAEGIGLSTRDFSSPSEFHAEQTLMNSALEELLTLHRTELLLSHCMSSHPVTVRLGI
jgi:hypothetical protein